MDWRDFGVGGALGEDQAAAFAVHLDHAHRDRLADHFLPALFRRLASGLAAANGADLRGRHEPAQAFHAGDQAAFVEPDDLAFDDLIARQQLLDVIPGNLFLGTLERKDNIAILIFRVDNIHVDFLTHLRARHVLPPLVVPARDQKQRPRI